MVHFIFSVVVVLLWLVAWGIYLVSGKRLKEEMEGIEILIPIKTILSLPLLWVLEERLSVFFPRYQTNR